MNGASFFLCARRENELKRIVNDLRVRGAKEVHFSLFDAKDSKSIVQCTNRCLKEYPYLDTVIIAHGSMPQMGEQNLSEKIVREITEVNYISIVLIINEILDHFKNRKTGTIAVISSVAGERGRNKFVIIK